MPHHSVQLFSHAGKDSVKLRIVRVRIAASVDIQINEQIGMAENFV